MTDTTRTTHAQTTAPQERSLKAPRAFAGVNWIGLQTLYIKEVRRFLKVSVQTVLAPSVQTVLFMAVLSLAWGDGRSDVLGVEFSRFLAPGLVMMSILTNAFANSSSSLIVAKIQGNAIDFLMPPLSASELAAAFIGGAATRGVLVGLIGIVVVSPFADIRPEHPLVILYFTVAASVLMASIGVIAGVWADKFDHLAAISNFIITPLTFLSGTFYSIERLPEALQAVSRANPFFHLIDGFRFGFIGVSDGSLAVAIGATLALNVILIVTVLALLRSGWRLKD